MEVNNGFVRNFSLHLQISLNNILIWSILIKHFKSVGYRDQIHVGFNSTNTIMLTFLYIFVTETCFQILL